MQNQPEPANNWKGEGIVVKESVDNGDGYIITIKTEEKINNKTYNSLIDIKISRKLNDIAQDTKVGDLVKVEGPLTITKVIFAVKFENISLKIRKKSQLGVSRGNSITCL